MQAKNAIVKKEAPPEKKVPESVEAMTEEQLQKAIALLNEKGISLGALKAKLSIKANARPDIECPEPEQLAGKSLDVLCKWLAFCESKAGEDARYKQRGRQIRYLLWTRDYVWEAFAAPLVLEQK